MRYQAARRFVSKISALAVLLILTTAQGQAEIYKWIDADGNVHFTDQKTQQHDNVEKVDVKVKTVSPEDKAAAKQRHAAAVAQREQRQADSAAMRPKPLTAGQKSSLARTAQYCQNKRDAVKAVEEQRKQMKLNGYTDDGLARLAKKMESALAQVELHCN